MNEINLLSLVSNMPKALPIPKEFVIVCRDYGSVRRTGNRKYLFFTPIGYLFRTKFRLWLFDEKMTEQEWYDKYYLNITLPSQRPKCALDGCNNITPFRYTKWGYEYSKFCCHSHCQKNNWSREGGEISKKKKSASLSMHFNNGPSRELRSLQTRIGKIKKILNECDDLSEDEIRWSLETIELMKIKIEKLSPEVKKNNSSSIKGNPKKDRKPKSLPNEGMSLEDLYKYKILVDKVHSRLLSNRKSGYVRSFKCSNSKHGYVFYDSSYELAYIMSLELDPSVKSYFREPSLGLHYYYNGDLHIYVVDFLVEYIDGRKSLVETKGYVDNKEVVELKSEAAIKYCNLNGIEYQYLSTKSEIFKLVSVDEVNELHNYNVALRKGYKSLDEKLREFIDNKHKISYNGGIM